MKLEVQPVPRGNWGDNLAHLLPKEIWDTLRRKIYELAENKCILCSDFSKTLHCHENWVYNDNTQVQYLKSLLSLCYTCHHVIHWFRTEQEIRKGTYPKSYITDLREHFIKVNECTMKEFSRHVAWADRKKHLRNFRSYTLVYGNFSVERITAAYEKRYKNGD